VGREDPPEDEVVLQVGEGHVLPLARTLPVRQADRDGIAMRRHALGSVTLAQGCEWPPSLGRRHDRGPV
jgi:hypothetical protein